MPGPFAAPPASQREVIHAVHTPKAIDKVVAQHLSSSRRRSIRLARVARATRPTRSATRRAEWCDLVWARARQTVPRAPRNSVGRVARRHRRVACATHAKHIPKSAGRGNFKRVGFGDSSRVWKPRDTAALEVCATQASSSVLIRRCASTSARDPRLNGLSSCVPKIQDCQLPVRPMKRK